MDERLENDVEVEDSSSSKITSGEIRAYLEKQRHLLNCLATYRTNCSDLHYSGIVRL